MRVTSSRCGSCLGPNAPYQRTLSRYREFATRRAQKKYKRDPPHSLPNSALSTHDRRTAALQCWCRWSLSPGAFDPEGAYPRRKGRRGAIFAVEARTHEQLNSKLTARIVVRINRNANDSGDSLRRQSVAGTYQDSSNSECTASKISTNFSAICR